MNPPPSQIRLGFRQPGPPRLRFAWLRAGLALAGLMAASALRADTNQVIYADALQNGWQNWSWATVDLANSAPTHSGQDSVSVTAGAYSALYLHNGQAGSWNPTVFNTLTFWVNGGAVGGQQISLVGLTQDPAHPTTADVEQKTVVLPALLANTWTQIQTPLSALGVAGTKTFSAIYLLNNSGSALPVFYVDDIQLTSALAPTNSTPTNAVGPNDLIIYDDKLNTDAWENWSWASSANWENTSPVHSGSHSLALQLGQYTALAVHGCPPVSAAAYPNLVFWINGGPQGGQNLTVQATVNMPGPTPLDGVYEHTNILQTATVAVGPLAPNTWVEKTIPLSALGVTGAQMLGDLWIWNTTDPNQATFYLDDIRLAASTASAPVVVADIEVNAAASRHPIDPRIYGTANTAGSDLTALNASVERQGGDLSSTYNWEINADNLSNDWYFESYPSSDPTPGGDVDQMIAECRAAGAGAMVTIPMLGWVAKLGPDRGLLWSYSIAKYGPQTGSDPYYPDAGNGILAATGARVTGNDPTDAYIPSSPGYQQAWIQHLTNRWGVAAQGGVGYYLMDNEPSIWQGTHADVQPTGMGMDAFLARYIQYASLVRSMDPGASIVGPEEWGWPGYIRSGLDQQNQNTADQAAHGGQYYLPWLLGQLQQHETATGQRLMDFFSLHVYPQGGEYSDDVSTAMQLRRNRSTRALWDTNYVDETWVCDSIQLIPRMKAWVAARYPGLKTAVTEYSWGAENHINGATAQADILGIFGREGLDMATRWSNPNPTNYTYKSIQLYRNYDGRKSTFGDVSVLATGPDPDYVSAFAAQRSSDGALTVMVINKQLTNDAPLNLSLAGFQPGASAEVWRLTKANAIAQAPAAVVRTNTVVDTLPAQSVSLYVIPPYVAAPSLLAVALPAGDRIQLVLSGAAGQRCVLESSPDLATWAAFSTNTLSGSPSAIAAPAAGGATFYRALALP